MGRPTSTETIRNHQWPFNINSDHWRVLIRRSSLENLFLKRSDMSAVTWHQCPVVETSVHIGWPLECRWAVGRMMENDDRAFSHLLSLCPGRKSFFIEISCNYFENIVASFKFWNLEFKKIHAFWDNVQAKSFYCNLCSNLFTKFFLYYFIS